MKVIFSIQNNNFTGSDAEQQKPRNILNFNMLFL